MSRAERHSAAESAGHVPGGLPDAPPRPRKTAPDTTPHWTVAAFDRAIVGGMVGFVGACLLAGIGLARWLFASLRNHLVMDADGLGWLVLYVLGGAVAGGAGGVLFPLAKSRLGAVRVGMVAVQPLLAAIFYMEMRSDPTAGDALVFMWGGMTLVFGPAIGLAWTRPWYSPVKGGDASHPPLDSGVRFR